MSARKAGRKQRTPMGGAQLRLEAERKEGFYSRWINDEPGRLDKAQQAGYTFRSDDGTASDSGDTRITRHIGGGERAYLMELPNEFRDQDVQEAQDRIDRKEAAILRKGPVSKDAGHKLSDDPTAYVETATVRRGS